MSIIRKKERQIPALNTSSLPDLIFTVLFFFMIVTHMRSVPVKVAYEAPKGTELAKLAKKSTTAGLLARSISTPEALSIPNAKSRKLRPNRKSPTYRCFPICIRTMPTRKAGQTTFAMLKEKPADMIHALMVVPMLAPMITEMA